MSYRYHLIIALALAHGMALAEQHPPVAADPPEAFVAPEPPSEAQQLERHCKDLQAQMRELKNHPLRRSAVADRYKLECQDPPYGGGP